MDAKTLFSIDGVPNLLFWRTSISGMLKVVLSEPPFRDQPYSTLSMGGSGRVGVRSLGVGTFYVISAFIGRADQQPSRRCLTATRQ